MDAAEIAAEFDPGATWDVTLFELCARRTVANLRRKDRPARRKADYEREQWRLHLATRAVRRRRDYRKKHAVVEPSHCFCGVALAQPTGRGRKKIDCSNRCKKRRLKQEARA